MTEPPSSPPLTAPPAVLIVDDVEANLVALRALLEDTHCSVTSASSGTQALRQLLRQEFAVMLLDVQMPEMDGYEVARHARMNPATRDVPIIFLTATHNSEENVLRGYGSGAVDFLFKPIDRDVLRSKVRIFLELYEGRRQLAFANLHLRQVNQELSAAYKELQQTQSQLVQSAKMASLGELVAGVAHEINNPLQSISGFAELLRLQRNLPESAQNDLDIILRESARANAIIRNLALFARQQPGPAALIQLSAVIAAVAELRQRRLESEQIELHIEDSSRQPVLAVLTELQQVVLNFVINAEQAILASGRIPARVTIRTHDRGSRVVLEVEDTGPGVKPEDEPRLFEPFFTTKPVGQGTGLGLSISYGIIESLGGKVAYRPAPAGGAIFYFELPADGRA